MSVRRPARVARKLRVWPNDRRLANQSAERVGMACCDFRPNPVALAVAGCAGLESADGGRPVFCARSEVRGAAPRKAAILGGLWRQRRHSARFCPIRWTMNNVGKGPFRPTHGASRQGGKPARKPAWPDGEATDENVGRQNDHDREERPADRGLLAQGAGDATAPSDRPATHLEADHPLRWSLRGPASKPNAGALDASASTRTRRPLDAPHSAGRASAVAPFPTRTAAPPAPPEALHALLTAQADPEPPRQSLAANAHDSDAAPSSAAAVPPKMSVAARAKPADRLRDAAAMPVRPLPPAEAMGRLLGVLAQEGRRTESAAAKMLAARALNAYLTSSTELSSLVTLGQAAARRFRRAGLADVAAECDHIVASAVRDPAAMLRAAAEVLADEAKKLPDAHGEQVEQWSRAASVRLPSFAADPAACMAAAIYALSGPLTEIRQARSSLAIARDLLERRDRPLSEKAAELEIVADAADEAGEWEVATALDRAGWHLREAALAAETYAFWAEMGATPRICFDEKLSLASVVQRVVVLSELHRLLDGMPSEQQDVVEQAIMLLPPSTQGLAAVEHGAQLTYLTQRIDDGALRRLRHNAERMYLMSNLAAVLREAQLPSSALLTLRDTEAMQQMRNITLARAPLIARDEVAKLDVLESLAGRWEALLAQVTPTLSERNDAVHQRAFETMFVTRMLENAPLSTLSTWSQLGKVLANHTEQVELDEESRSLLRLRLRAMLQERGQRSWDQQAPRLQHLMSQARAPSVSDEQFASLTLRELRKPARTGYDVASKVDLIRHLFVALQELEVAPSMEETGDAYYSLVVPNRDRVSNLTTSTKGLAPAIAGPNQARAAMGIMALHQPLPEPQPTALAAPAPGLMDLVNLESPTSRAALAHGAPLVSGVSGTTNIMLHLFDWAQRKHDGRFAGHGHDVALGTMLYVTSDGGHSAQEVMWVFEHALDGKYAPSHETQAPQGLAQVRALFNGDPRVEAALMQSAVGLAKLDATLQAMKKTQRS